MKEHKGIQKREAPKKQGARLKKYSDSNPDRVYFTSLWRFVAFKVTTWICTPLGVILLIGLFMSITGE